MKKPNKPQPRPSKEVLALRENCRYWRDAYFELKRSIENALAEHSSAVATQLMFRTVPAPPGPTPVKFIVRA